MIINKQLLSQINQLKITVSDGKTRLIDGADTEQLLRLLQPIMSIKAKYFTLLTRVKP
jgi:hypothetical protein